MAIQTPALGIEDFALGEDHARVVETARRASRSALPVLVEGESGTGRSSLAAAISGGTALTVTGALPVPMAGTGTLIIEAVESLPAADQGVLFAALAAAPDGRACGRRVIAIAGADFLGRVAAGGFRDDLYYRLGALSIVLPPLRRTPDALTALAQRFAGAPLEAETLVRLAAHDWPGNIAELRATIAVARAAGPLTAARFAALPQRPPRPAEGPAVLGLHVVAMPEDRAGQGALGIQAMGDDGELRALDAVEADMIRLALAHYRGQMSEIARRLGIGRSTLYRKIRELGLEEPALGG